MSNDIERFLKQCVAFNNGIAPLDDVWSASHDYNRILASMPPEEAKKMKRKFRKLWRKLAPNEATPCQVPGRKQCYNRKVAVMEHFQKTFVQPKLDALTEVSTPKSST